MFKRSIPLLLVMLIAGVFSFATAQDPTPTVAPPTNVQAVPTATPEPLPDCPAFESEDESVRRSYYMGEGTAYLNSGQVFDAIFSYTCVIRVIDPQYIPAYMVRASSYARQRDYERAIADYTRAIELDGSLAAAYNNRGILYTAIREFDEAAADFERVMSLEPANYTVANNRAVLYMINGDFDAALAVLEEVVGASGINEVLAAYQDPERLQDAEEIEFDPAAARAIALIGIVYSQKSLDQYRDYAALAEEEGQFSLDQRIMGAAGALESRFTFEMRLDDGSWMSLSPYQAVEE